MANKKLAKCCGADKVVWVRILKNYVFKSVQLKDASENNDCFIIIEFTKFGEVMQSNSLFLSKVSVKNLPNQKHIVGL